MPRYAVHYLYILPLCWVDYHYRARIRVLSLDASASEIDVFSGKLSVPFGARDMCELLVHNWNLISLAASKFS